MSFIVELPIGYKPVIKHGDHDQSSHGSWAQGLQVAPEIVRSTLESVKANGRLTVEMKDGSSPKDGFMVAKGKKFAAIVKADDFFDEAKGAEILSSYMKQHKSEFNNSNNYLGLWHNTNDGQVYLDVSENIKDEGEAISRGRERDQISIWDVANLKEIETGGTGGIEKTRSGTTARFVEHDRRTDRRLRQRDLGEVSKTLKVIYFDYGLKPVLKHEGHEDQSSHGNWARGYTSAEIELIESMKEKGPSVDDLDSAIKESSEYTQTDEQLKLIVENDPDLEREATRDIDEQFAEALARNQEIYPNHEFTEQEKSELYENVQNRMIDEWVESNRDNLTDLAAGMDGESDANAQDLIEPFNDIYGIEHTGKNFDGEERTISSKIIETQLGSRGDGSSIIVDGIINNENDEEIGFIQREFFKENGVWNVEHYALVIEQGEYKGTGFGKEIIQKSEAWYVARDFGYITVGTAMDGARHWARAGYDFNPEYLRENARSLIFAASDRFDAGTPEKTEFDNLMGKYLDGYVPSSREPMYSTVRDMKDEGFPLPADFANIGYTPGAKDWAGKELTRSLNMKYVKVLTPEGQKLMDGPIDHDGDGMIYDGTSREKPAPSGGNK